MTYEEFLNMLKDWARHYGDVRKFLRIAISDVDNPRMPNLLFNGHVTDGEVEIL